MVLNATVSNPTFELTSPASRLNRDSGRLGCGNRPAAGGSVDCRLCDLPIADVLTDSVTLSELSDVAALERPYAVEAVEMLVRVMRGTRPPGESRCSCVPNVGGRAGWTGRSAPAARRRRQSRRASVRRGELMQGRGIVAGPNLPAAPPRQLPQQRKDAILRAEVCPIAGPYRRQHGEYRRHMALT